MHEFQNCIFISHTTEGDGGDFFTVTCTTVFTAGSVPGALSTPPCAITINDDSIVEENETFSLSAILSSISGQSVDFTVGSDSSSASATILDDDSKSVHACKH